MMRPLTPCDRTTTLPGMSMDAARRRGRLMRLAYAPLRPTKPQEACDVGLFSDNARQLDLVDVLRARKT